VKQEIPKGTYGLRRKGYHPALVFSIAGAQLHPCQPPDPNCRADLEIFAAAEVLA
jgi:hypothetical protein